MDGEDKLKNVLRTNSEAEESLFTSELGRFNIKKKMLQFASDVIFPVHIAEFSRAVEESYVLSLHV